MPFIDNIVTLHAPNPIVWGLDVLEDALTTAKAASASAPVLGLPDCVEPFHLFVHEREGFVKAVPCQGQRGYGGKTSVA